MLVFQAKQLLARYGPWAIKWYLIWLVVRYFAFDVETYLGYHFRWMFP